jgi:hypothetical protein
MLIELSNKLFNLNRRPKVRPGLILYAAFFVVTVLLISCSEEDCATCADDIETIFMCTTGYSEPEVSGPEASVGVTAGFFGTPVPEVSSFKWLGMELDRCDEGFPCYDFGMPGEYRKSMDVQFVIASDTFALDLIVPDSFHLIQPSPETLRVDAGVPLEVVWSRSSDADRYSLKVYVLLYDFHGTTVELDSNFYTADTSVTLSAFHLKPGRAILLMLLAMRGVLGEPGDVANFSHGNLRGFLSTGYKTRGLMALIN